MHLPELLKMLIASAFGSVVACGASATADHAESVGVWRARAIEASRFHLTDMCMETAPLESVDPENPDFLECMKQAGIAVAIEHERLREQGLRSCLNDGNAKAGCCFERVSSSPFEKKRQAECITNARRQRIVSQHLADHRHASRWSWAAGSTRHLDSTPTRSRAWKGSASRIPLPALSAVPVRDDAPPSADELLLSLAAEAAEEEWAEA
jgi:hypothetical protein